MNIFNNETIFNIPQVNRRICPLTVNSFHDARFHNRNAVEDFLSFTIILRDFLPIASPSIGGIKNQCSDAFCRNFTIKKLYFNIIRTDAIRIVLIIPVCGDINLQALFFRHSDFISGNHFFSGRFHRNQFFSLIFHRRRVLSQVFYAGRFCRFFHWLHRFCRRLVLSRNFRLFRDFRLCRFFRFLRLIDFRRRLILSRFLRIFRLSRILRIFCLRIPRIIRLGRVFLRVRDLFLFDWLNQVYRKFHADLRQFLICAHHWRQIGFAEADRLCRIGAKAKNQRQCKQNTQHFSKVLRHSISPSLIILKMHLICHNRRVIWFTPPF